MKRSLSGRNLWCTLAVTLLLSSVFAGSALADKPTNPDGMKLTLLNVSYVSPYTSSAVTLYNYRLTWNGNPPGLSHVNLQVCNSLISAINATYTTPHYQTDDGSVRSQCSLPGFDAVSSTTTIVKWDAGALTLVGDHYDFTLAINGTYGAGTTNWVAFAGSECEPTNGSTVEGPSCDTTVGCTTEHPLPWCPPICFPPAISVKPVDQNACPNSATPFSIQTTGTVTSIQWSFNGTPIEGATSRSYTPTLGAGTYAVSVASTCGRDSASATLSFKNATLITSAPSNQSVCPTDTIQPFTVTATGEGTISYAWFDSNNTQVGTGSSFTPSVTASGTYNYHVVATGGCGTDSANVSLTIKKATKITTAPVNQSTCVEFITKPFTVSATGEGTVTYEWFFNNQSVGTGSSFTPTRAGTYTVVATAGCGTASATATLTLIPCPPTCTLTQGAWGSFGGAGNINDLTNAIGGGLTVGSGSNTFTITSSSYDIQCAMLRLPAGGAPTALPAGANRFAPASGCLTTTLRTVTKGRTSTTTDAMLSGTSSKDKFINNLLGQTLTLALNVRGDANLGGTPLCKYMRVEILNGGSARTLDSAGGIPEAVWTAMGPNPTVQSLIDLANGYLGGGGTSPTFSEVNQAVTAINQLFDACPTKRYVTSCLPTAPIAPSSAVTALASGTTPVGLCTSIAAVGEDGSVTSIAIPRSILRTMVDLGLNTELRGLVTLRQMVREGYDDLSFEDLNVAIKSLNDAVAQGRTIVPCTDR